MQTVLLHVANEEPIMAEVENMPTGGDQLIYCVNPRRRDGKDLTNVLPEVQTIAIPMWRIIFIEIMPTGQEEEIVAFYKD